MKRIIICAVLFAGAIALSVYSSCKVISIDNQMAALIGALSEPIESENREELFEGVSKIRVFWDEQEGYLVHLIRHNHIDNITISVSRLSPLAAHGDFSEVSAELASIRRQMEHIRSSEVFTFKNLF